VDQLLHAIAQLISDWGGILFFFLVLGGGDAIGRALSGRRANQKLRGELKASKAELTCMHSLVSNAFRALGGNGTPDVAALAEQARSALNDRAVALDLLNQVQAADRAYPQLPQELRDDIDQALLRLRARPSAAEGVTAAKELP
jgi:hypothetical protein